MKHVELIRKTDYGIGAALLLASLVLLFSAGRLVAAPYADKQNLAAKALVVASGQCTATLKSIGIAHTESGKTISVKEPSIRDLPSLMERSSLALQSCAGYTLQEFCAGENCLPERGLLMSLEYKGD